MGVYGYNCDGCGALLKGQDVTVSPDGDQYPTRTLTSSLPATMDLKKYDLCQACFGECEKLLKASKQGAAS